MGGGVDVDDGASESERPWPTGSNSAFSVPAAAAAGVSTRGVDGSEMGEEVMRAEVFNSSSEPSDATRPSSRVVDANRFVDSESWRCGESASPLCSRSRLVSFALTFPSTCVSFGVLSMSISVMLADGSIRVIETTVRVRFGSAQINSAGRGGTRWRDMGGPTRRRVEGREELRRVRMDVLCGPNDL